MLWRENAGKGFVINRSCLSHLIAFLSLALSLLHEHPSCCVFESNSQDKIIGGFIIQPISLTPLKSGQLEHQIQLFSLWPVSHYNGQQGIKEAQTFSLQSACDAQLKPTYSFSSQLFMKGNQGGREICSWARQTNCG